MSMGLRISEIHIDECGPLNKQSWTELEKRNLVLIYGKNESGKSFLIDLLINLLFKNKGNWCNVRGGVNGRVVLTSSLTGSTAKDTGKIEFRVRGRVKKKLEEYLEELPGSGIPADLTKLLIVRAGEVEIVRDEYGLTVEFLKNLFSQKQIINKIRENIKTTIENAEILEEEGRINVSAKTNEVKEYHNLSDKIKELENLLHEVSEKYEMGEIKALNEKKKQLEEKKARLELARRHLAFSLAREVDERKKELEHFPSEDDIAVIKVRIDEFKHKSREVVQISAQIKNLDDEIADKEKVEQELKLQERARRYQARLLWQEKKQKREELIKIEENTQKINELHRHCREKVMNIKQKENDLENKKPLAEEYQWLKAVKENYLKLMVAGKKPLLPLRPITFITLFISLLGVILLLLGKTGLALLFWLLSLLGFIYIIWLSSRLQTGEAEAREIQAIKKKYRQKYGKELNSITELEAREKILEKEFYTFEGITNQLEQLKTESNQLLTDLNLLLATEFPSGKIDEKIEMVEKILTENQNKIIRLRQEIEDISSRLSKLDIEEKDFEYENPGIEYNQLKYDELKRKMDRLTQRKADKDKLCSNLQNYNFELNELKKEISHWFERRFEEKIEPDLWEDKLQQVESKKKKLESEINSKTGELKGLGVWQADYLAEDPGETYHPDKMKEVEKEIEEVSKEISEKDNELRILKTLVASQTGSDPSESWNFLLGNLFHSIEETKQQLKKIEAILISRILLAEVIKNLDRKETEKVERILKSSEASQLLFRLTNRYREIYPELTEEKKTEILLVSDGVNAFSLAELSTGTREQVLLALRIAFIKNLLRNQTCFLILDDAFQHTDYDRRPLVVDALVELAKVNWQIFYLTMDDHIRNLFQMQASSLGSQYHFIEL